MSAPGQDAMSAFTAAQPAMLINSKMYIQRPKGSICPFIFIWAVVFVVVGYVIANAVPDLLSPFSLIMIIALLAIIFKSYPTRFIHSENEEFLLLEQGCVENPLDAACSCQKSKVELDKTDMGYVQPAKCCDSGICYECGCLCKGQAIKYKVYVKEGGGEASVKYTIRETIQCCGCIQQCCLVYYYALMSAVVPYAHYKQDLYGPDLSDKTVKGSINWLTYRGELLTFGSTANGGDAKGGADTAVRMALPVLYHKNGAFPPAGIPQNTKQKTNMFIAPKDVV
jgi:hypothetical protein